MLRLLDSIAISDLVGWLVGLAGLVYAWYQNREAKRLKDVARSEAWNLYQAANVACGKVQGVLGMYKSSHGENIHTDVLEELSKADACSLEVFKSTIRHIQMVEPRFDVDAIDYWIKSKKIPEHQWKEFRGIVVDPKIPESGKDD